MRENTLDCQILYNKFGGYCIPTAYFPFNNTAKEIKAGKVHELETIDFIKSHCGDGDVIHAGAYVGDFLPAISDSLAPEVKLLAWEPNPINFLCAKITKLINRLDNVQLYNAALGEFFGVASLKTTNEKKEPLGGMSEIGKNGNETVCMMTIDDTIPDDRKVSIIHLDVEGYERQALTGGLQTTTRCKPIIILETVPDKKWMAENIIKLGYKRSKNVGRNTAFIYKGE